MASGCSMEVWVWASAEPSTNWVGELGQLTYFQPQFEEKIRVV